MLRAQPRGRDLGLVVIAAMMGAAAYLAVRNMALAVIASTTPLCRHAALALAATRFGNPAPPAPRKRSREALVGGFALVIALATGSSRPTCPTATRSHGRDNSCGPSGCMATCSTIRMGEFLIFQLGPESKVFIDSRYDMVYPQAVIADYLDFLLVRPDAAAVLDAYPHDFVLFGAASPGCRFMMAQPGWRSSIGTTSRPCSPARTRPPHGWTACRYPRLGNGIASIAGNGCIRLSGPPPSVLFFGACYFKME